MSRCDAGNYSTGNDPVLGVATPQGSALGLLLLLIYVNDILNIEIRAAGSVLQYHG